VDAGESAADMFRAGEGRWGSGGIEITDVAFLNDQGETTHMFHSGEPLTLRLHVRAARPAHDFVFGVGIFNAEGVCVYGTNTDIEEHDADTLQGDAEVSLVFDALDLVEGTYKMDVAVHKRDGAPYDYHRLLYTFRVKSRLKDVGIYRPRHHWRFAGGVEFKTRA
jgi:Wzt-like putative exopolysaccharide export protein